MEKDHFKHKASDYEKDHAVKNNVNNIAELILKEISFNKEMNIMDFGSGTGFLLEGIAPYVNKITAVDISDSMIQQLNAKKESIPCEVEILKLDLTKDKLNKKFDAVISSMTLHHIKDIKSIMKVIYDCLDESGSIALADLDTEKGNFHTSDTGVYHFGFNRNFMKTIAKEVGFKNIKIQHASDINKPHGLFTVFLLTAKK